MSTKPGPVCCSAPIATSNPPLSGLLYFHPVVEETFDSPFFLNKLHETRKSEAKKIITESKNLTAPVNIDVPSTPTNLTVPPEYSIPRPPSITSQPQLATSSLT